MNLKMKLSIGWISSAIALIAGVVLSIVFTNLKPLFETLGLFGAVGTQLCLFLFITFNFCNFNEKDEVKTAG